MTTETILTDEQITEQFEWYVDDPEHSNTFMVFARSIEQAVLQSPEVQALREDAERWGYVLKNPWRAIDALKVNCLTSPARWADEANEAIDHAMKEQKT